MKKLLPYISLLLLSALAIWLWNRSQDRSSLGGIEKEWSEFSIEDTASIDRIVISDKVPMKVDLIKTDGKWQLNGRALRKDAIEVLLETLKRMEMRNFVAENSKDEILRRMATYGKEVIVYSKGEEIAHFFVGTDTPDHLATYMLKKGAELPFAVHIPGFNGYLSSRFITKEVLWYNRSLIGQDVSNLNLFKMDYSDASMPSVHLQKNDDASWQNLIEPDMDQKWITAYLKQLEKANYEGAIVTSDKIFMRKDSLLNSTPYLQFAWADMQGNSHWLKAYKIKAEADAADAQGNPLNFDPDRMHAIYDDGRMVLLQFYGLRFILGGPQALSKVVE